jgi:Domain of unknown function (DUF4440)
MSTPLELEISDFFGHRYNEAWNFDGDRIASLYNAPTVTMRGDGSIHCLQSHAELARFFQGVLDTYKREGFQSATMHDLEVVPLGARSALATMTWKMLRADGSSIREWRQSYNVVRHEDGWRILVSTFHLGG